MNSRALRGNRDCERRFSKMDNVTNFAEKYEKIRGEKLTLDELGTME